MVRHKQQDRQRHRDKERHREDGDSATNNETDKLRFSRTSTANKFTN